MAKLISLWSSHSGHALSPRLNVDLDAQGNVVGFDIDRASQKLELSTLETVALPVKVTKAA